MKKIKKFWQENSVLLVLFLILIACVIAISVVVVTYFVGTGTDKYGDRLDGIEEHEFSLDAQSDIINALESDDLIEDVKISVSGKTIYMYIYFVTSTTLVEGQGKALAALELFDESILEYYDIEFLISAEETEESDGFTIIGAHNVTGTGGIVWNNNTEVEEDEDTESE